MRRAITYLIPFLVSGTFILAACSAGTGGDATPTPLPTSSLPGLVTIQHQLCRLAELPMLRVDEPQGDLIAWAPNSNALAYLAPTSGSTWMVGALMVASAPAFDSPRELADQAAGSLAWSPSGSRIAYLSLRRSDSLYSVGVVDLAGGLSSDLFLGETARYDEWSSQKAVAGWEDEHLLHVQVSCGLDCMQTVEVNLLDGSRTPLAEASKRPWDWWGYSLNQPVELAAEYQEFMDQPNWAPDAQQLVYLDAWADAWVVNLEAGTQFLLDTGGFLAVSETDWSAGGQFLAVQAEDSLFIFSSDCP